jgi:glutamate N-acetyltransferase/amino-acid N-acetyltransferase
MEAALPAAVSALAADNWERAAQGIMTTDTVPKGASRQVTIDGVIVTITGIAKGAGMIKPDMATMLAFVATDAAIEAGALRSCLRETVSRSFNAITVDGDTSTNDACVLIATGKVGHAPLDHRHPAFSDFCAAVEAVCIELAQAIVRDGEGATKFIVVRVDGARSAEEARRTAYAVAESPLVKTAFFAGDPNWGRILAAVGRSGVEGLEIDCVQVFLDALRVVTGGGVDPNYREADGAAVVRKPEFVIRVSLGRGDAAAEVWTCDFSYDYVRINAEYRS